MSGLIAKMLRYSIASIGPVASAGAQFFLSLVLLRILAPTEFGSFSFLLITFQLSWAIWGALFCAPLPILLMRPNGQGEALLQCLFAANLFGALVAFLVFFGMAAALGASITAAALAAGYGAIALLRWFARAYAYALGEPLKTMSSDLVYCGVLVCAVVVALAAHLHSSAFAYGALLLSAALGLAPFGKAYLVGQFIRIKPSAIMTYPAIWREHSGWSLMGVLTTEATANAHVYLVTWLYGAKAFAPIAASSLLIRPVSVAMNALTEYERAQMARQIARRDIEGAVGSVRFFRWVLVAAWTVTALATALLLIYAPRLVFPHGYAMSVLATGAALWLAVAGMRTLRTPESAVLQAAGAFRPLALASVYSAGVSVVAVCMLLWSSGTLWSIFGIFLGELIYAIWIWRHARTWRDTERANAAALPPGSTPEAVAASA